MDDVKSNAGGEKGGNGRADKLRSQEHGLGFITRGHAGVLPVDCPGLAQG